MADGMDLVVILVNGERHRVRDEGGWPARGPTLKVEANKESASPGRWLREVVERGCFELPNGAAYPATAILSVSPWTGD